MARIPQAAAAILFVGLILHTLAAEPVGASEEVVPEASPLPAESHGQVMGFPDTPQDVDALVNEVLVEVEGASGQPKHNNNNNQESPRVSSGKVATAQEDAAEPEVEMMQAETDADDEESETVGIYSHIPTVNLWAFAVIITFLVFFTLIFEHGKEHIVEHTKGTPNQPIVTSIFSELTVLGFLALLCFLVNKFGLHHVSLLVFGHHEQEDREKLGEMLENIHFVIFLVMIIFVCEALGMIWISTQEADKFRRFEGQIITVAQRKELLLKWKAACEDKPSSIEMFFGCSARAQEYAHLQRVVRFMLFRQEFIHDANQSENLKRDFSFTLYLTKVMGERLGEIIELPVTQWIALEVTCLALLCATAVAADGSWIFLLVVCVVWSCLLLLVAHLFRNELREVQHQLTHECDGLSMLEAPEIKAHDAAMARAREAPDIPDTPPAKPAVVPPESSPAEASEAEVEAEPSEAVVEAADAAGGDGVDSAAHAPTGSGTGAEDTDRDDEIMKVDLRESLVLPDEAEHHSWILSRPRYKTNDALDQPRWPCCAWARPALKRKDVATEKRRFYNLFTFGRGELHWHLFMIRFFFLGTAVYMSVYCIQIIPAYIDEAFGMWSAMILSLAGVLPGLTVYTHYVYEIIHLSVMCTSVEYFRYRRMVEQVKRSQKEQRAVMLLRIIVALHKDDEETKLSDRELAKVQHVLDDPDSVAQKQITGLLETDTSLELEPLAEIFDNFDKDGSGFLTKSEVEEVLVAFGLKLPEGSHKNENFFKFSQGSPRSAHNVSKEDGGEVFGPSISKAEFLTFMVNKAKQAEDMEAEEITEWCFERWDPDKSNHLTVEELQDGLRTLGESFTPNEISAVIVELDLNDDGEFDHEEFTHWIHTRSTGEHHHNQCWPLC